MSPKWLTPEEMLQEHLELKAFIAPPQIYELSRLANFRDYASLLDFAIKREKYGIERWSYQINGMQDGKRKKNFYLPEPFKS